MPKKPLTGFAVSIAVTVLIAYMLSPYYALLNPMGGVWRGLLYADLPNESEIHAEELKASVNVCRDSYGVPHIYAENEEDLFFVFGYVQAQDRLFQMDFQRRFARGKLAEVVGEALYETDVFFRVIGLERGADSTLQALTSQNDYRMLTLLESFAQGVNKAIDNMKAAGELPIEFTVLGCEPESWAAIDTLVIGKLIAWSLTGNFYDLEFMKAHEAFGDLTDELFPLTSPYETCTYNGDFLLNDLRAQESSRELQHYADKDREVVEAVDAILKWKEEAEKWLPPVKGMFASNNWVVNGSLTTTGKPILCNDPHLEHVVPPVWYEAHLVVRNSSGVFMNVRGVTFPGIPVIVIGHNNFVAWGFTNVGADVIDFYRYIWNDAGNQYWYLNRWENVTETEELIKIKVGDSIVETTVNINMTRHGPVIERNSEKFALKWTGQYPTMEARAMYAFNVANSLDDFELGLGDFQVPAQNIVYADIYGNIGWWANGRYPIRMNVSDANSFLEYRLPFNGSQARGEWGEWSDADAWLDPPEEVPHVVNPKAGCIATANNCPMPREKYSHWLGWTWADNYRVKRILRLLGEFQPLSLEDMKEIQTDIYSIAAQNLVPYIINACRDRQLNQELEDALDLMGNWDFVMDKGQVAPAIFAAWVEKLKNNTFFDEYNRAEFEGRYPSTETVQYLVEENSVRWFDNVDTETTETRDDIIFQSFVEAVQLLREALGAKMSEWKWGTIHHTDIVHLLGSALSWLNYPELSVGGWEDSVNPAWGLKVISGASWRQIIDLDDLNSSICVIPGGQRGHPFSKHYYDQLELWLNGEYKPMTFPASPEEQADTESIMMFRGKG